MPIETEHPTPAGGVRSVLYALNEQGEEVEDPADSHHGLVIEYDGAGAEIKRTYFGEWDPDQEPFETAGTEQFQDPNQLDTDDMLKGSLHTFDIYVVDDDGEHRLVEGLADWFLATGVGSWPLDEARREIGAFMGGPSWDMAPPRLKAEMGDFLVRTRQE